MEEPTGCRTWEGARGRDRGGRRRDSLHGRRSGLEGGTGLPGQPDEAHPRDLGAPLRIRHGEAEGATLARAGRGVGGAIAGGAEEALPGAVRAAMGDDRAGGIILW